LVPVIETVCPDVMLVLLRMISLAEVPTVKPVIMMAAALLLKRATAAVPVLLAVAVSGVPGGPAKVSTPPDSVKLGFWIVMVARMEAYAAVAISNVPAVPASRAVTTAVIRELLTLVR
jgi:hypothetical protein